VRVLPVTRIVGAVLVPILAVTTLVLWGLPGETERLFAWTIRPDLTPIFMAAGYGSGVVFFTFVARGGYWLEVSFGFVGVAVFSTLMGIATFIHWDRFNHDHPAFFGWVALYVIAPFLIPALWVYNGGWRRGAPVPPDRAVPRWARVSLAVTGGLSFAIGIAIFVWPSLAIDHWPWDVTPLTARVVGSFLALNVGWAAAGLDGRWSAIRIPALSQVAGLLLLLVGILRSRDDLHTDRATTWIYLGALAGMLALLGWLLVSMSLRRVPDPRPPPVPSEGASTAG
jgi:hypothetical protein